MNWQDIPVYICNRNNLERGFRKQTEWLIDIGMTNINVIDNQSSYSPLLEYYSKTPQLRVAVQSANIGPRGFWEVTRQHENIKTPFIYTDCDVVPADICPNNVVEVMFELLQKQEPGRKVGVGLRIDNLPNHFSKKDLVIKWESGFWTPDRKEQINNEYGDGRAFNANVDTTFAMYHPQQEFTYTALRTDAPYIFEHVPWYADDSNPTEEDIYYREHYETKHEDGQMWKTDKGGWALYGWSVRSKASLEDTFRARGIE